MADTLPTIAVIGGTGNLGTGIAYRLTRKGYPVIIGSRQADKALAAAQEATASAGRPVQGMQNAAAAAALQACRDAGFDKVSYVPGS